MLITLFTQLYYITHLKILFVNDKEYFIFNDSLFINDLKNNGNENLSKS